MSQLLVPEQAAGKRLDAWLADALPDYSRSEIQRWIKEKQVQVDSTVARAGLKLKAGQAVFYTPLPEAASTELRPENIPLDIIYEDDDMAVINKPAGMVVHPAPGHPDGTLVNGLLYHFGQSQSTVTVQPPEPVEGGRWLSLSKPTGGSERLQSTPDPGQNQGIYETDGLQAGRPGIVHRLDQDTSGLIAVAKHNQAYRGLQAQFKARTVYKEYLALVEGHMEPPAARISAPIGRHPTDRKRQAILLPDGPNGSSKGREAITEYSTEGRYSMAVRSSNAVANFSLLRIKILTGRTHQIRVHLAWHKHPVVGDILYGYRKQRLPIARQFLHAHCLRLCHPVTNQELEFVAPLPDDLQSILDLFTIE